ncbi:MAG: YccF domain-containing protein [Rhodoplanes sp.]
MSTFATKRGRNYRRGSFLLNLLWIVFGGLWMAVGWMIAAVIMAVTIIGLPWTRAAFNIASYAFLPFGRKAVSRGGSLCGGSTVRTVRSVRASTEVQCAQWFRGTQPADGR